MPNLKIKLQFFYVCVSLALTSRTVAGYEYKKLESTVKTFGAALIPKMAKIEGIRSEFSEKLEYNNGLAASLFTEPTNLIYAYEHLYGDMKSIEKYGDLAYNADVEKPHSQKCFEFITDIAKYGRERMDNSSSCYNKLQWDGLKYLKTVESLIKLGLTSIDYLVSSFYHENQLSKDFSEVWNLDTYVQTENRLTEMLKSVISLKLKTIPEITKIWATFQRWYDVQGYNEFYGCQRATASSHFKETLERAGQDIECCLSNHLLKVCNAVNVL